MRRAFLIATSPLRSLSIALLCAGALACSVEEAGPGEECLRSTECAPGLVCIEGVCSNDVSSIADPGEVPELTPDAGMEPVQDAATMEPADAAMMMTPEVDAAAPVDGG